MTDKKTHEITVAQAIYAYEVLREGLTYSEDTRNPFTRMKQKALYTIFSAFLDNTISMLKTNVTNPTEKLLVKDEDQLKGDYKSAEDFVVEYK